MHTSSYQNMKNFVEKYLSMYKDKSLKILEVGSQDVNGTYRPLLNQKNWSYTGLDICEGPNVDIVVEDIYNWKRIHSNSYDVIISGQAFEHIEYFWLTMNEIARVLKPKGLCCIIAPSSGPEHKYPIDCWRFFPDGLEACAKYAKLDTVEKFTCWDSKLYGEENIWKDTVLICQKITRYSDFQKMKNRLKSSIVDIRGILK
jgi:SAM-dependent methyltransferase